MNVGTLRGHAGEVVETLTSRKVNVCCVQEVRWRGASARMITGKNSEYKMYWMGKNLGLDGVWILIPGKWIDIFYIKHVNECSIIIKLFIVKQIVAIVLTDASQQHKFYEDLIFLASKIGENELVMVRGGFNRHFGKDPNGYDETYGCFGCGIRNLEGQIILETGSALDMTVCNIFFKKHDARLITYTSRPSKIHIDYIRNMDRKRVRDAKVIDRKVA